MHQISILLLSLFMATSMCLPTELEGGIGELNQERFLFATKTVTNLIITTTTTNTLLRTWCYEVVSGLIPLTTTGLFSTDNISLAVADATLTAGEADTCQSRRRRWSFENVFDQLDGFDLTPAIPSSDQAAANVASIKMAETEEENIESTLRDEEKNPRFGLSLIHTVTQTLTAVSKIVTGTVVKKVLLTCTPQNLGGIQACHGHGHK